MSGLEIVPYSGIQYNNGPRVRNFLGDRRITSITLTVSLSRFVGFDLRLHAFEYKLLAAYYVQKARYRALMDERGILSRDELSNIQFRKAQLFNVSKYEELFTLTAKNKNFAMAKS